MLFKIIVGLGILEEKKFLHLKVQDRVISV